MACLVLHNIACKHHDYIDPIPNADAQERQAFFAKNQHLVGLPSVAGKAVRDHYINNLFR